MKRKGFTLTELLAVIVILSVITLITVPMITSVIEESKKKALVSSVQGVLDATEYFTMSHETGVYEFLFDTEHQGSTVKGEQLEYKGNIEGEGKLYIDKEGNTSICISNDNYYAYKNYNSDIVVGERKEGNCIIGFDALTNKYIAMLDDGTGQVSNVYSKDEINNIISNLSNVYATKEELENLNSKLNNLNVMYNDENDTLDVYIDGKWESVINCNLKVNYIVKNGSGSLVSYYVKNYIAANNGTALTLTFTKQGYSGFIIFSEDFSKYIGQGKKLYIYIKSSTNSWTDVNIRTSSSTSSESVSYYQKISPTTEQKEIVLDIDKVFSVTYKYLFLAANPSSANQNIVITNMFVK